MNRFLAFVSFLQPGPLEVRKERGGTETKRPATICKGERRKTKMYRMKFKSFNLTAKEGTTGRKEGKEREDW